jgi:hypothetical protein
MIIVSEDISKAAEILNEENLVAIQQRPFMDWRKYLQR